MTPTPYLAAVRDDEFFVFFVCFVVQIPSHAMLTPQAEIALIAAVVAAACALPGAFLVLRRLALLSDAIGHTVLLGIVLGFLWTRDLHSPYLFIGAVLTGVLTVSLVEVLHRTGLVKEDAAIGLVFPALFSLGVILIANYGRGGAHLDTDAVLLGELDLAPYKQRRLARPRSAVLVGGDGQRSATECSVYHRFLQGAEAGDVRPGPGCRPRFLARPVALRADDARFGHGGRRVRGGGVHPGGRLDGRAAGDDAAADGSVIPRAAG